ncbi:MAG: lipase family protein [Bacteroidota bacterium]
MTTYKNLISNQIKSKTYLFLSTICLQIALINSPHATNTITQYDQIAIDHAVMVFHAYQQIANQEAFDFTKPVLRKIPNHLDPFQKISELHLSKPKQLTKGWTFTPLMGQSGPPKNPRVSMLAYLAINKTKKIILLVFRGSRHLGDWYNNSRLTIKKSDHLAYKGYLHGGYVDIFEQSVHQLDALLKSCIHNVPSLKNYELIICGHSLGGAMATISAAYLVGNKFYTKHFLPKNIHLITFGSPHVGIKYQGHDFGQWMQAHMSHIKRFERATDLAPSLTHLCKIVVLKNKKYPKLAISAAPSPIAKCTLLSSAEDPNILFPNPHDVRNYRKLIYDILKLHYKPLFLRPIPKNANIGDYANMT